MLADKIRQKSAEYFLEILDMRRYLHANPELSFNEYNTSASIKAFLDKRGINWQAMANTGLVAMITGDLPSDRVIALRADMDALPIQEINTFSYMSSRPGIMHACGHDAHTASLLGTAAILQSMQKQFGGTVKLIFQPGEEVLPGGAQQMIKEGVLENPVPAAVIGQHVMPKLPTGMIGICSGKFMASMDEITLTVNGKGGHGAQPHLNTDPVLIAAHVLVAMQQVVSRLSNPTTPSVLSFGKVIAAGAINVIPQQVFMQGTFRTMDEQWRLEAHEQIVRIAKGICESMGGSCDIHIELGYPFLVNDELITVEVEKFSKEYLGEEKVIRIDPWMAAEDFAYYSQRVPSCFYLLGTGNEEKGIVSGLHSADFDIDEDSLETGMGLMAYIALRKLGNG